MIGQIGPCLGRTVTDPPGEELDGRLEVTLADGLNDNARTAHGTILT
jgi:hypothetical protein